MPATPFVDLPICEDLERPYRHEEAEENVRKWASSDGSGDLDKIDWKKFRKAFFWYDPEHENERKGYKLKFADVINGELQAVWHGVRLAMQVLNGARRGVNIPDEDRNAVYQHIVKYYKKFGKEPPALKKDADNAEHRDQPPTNTTFTRTFPLEVRSILDDENRIVEVSFSSEAAVEKWFGREILLHNKESANFSPLAQVGSILINHDPNQRVAKPIKVWLDEESKKGRAIIQFGSTSRALEAYQEVKEGLLRGVSVGYQVEEWMRLRENEKWNGFEGPAWIATRWSAFEISLTPVPADPSVGVGRAKNMKKEEDEMSEIQQNQKTIEELKNKAILAERQRIKEIRELCRTFEIDELADELIEKGTSIDEARKVVLEKLAQKKENQPLGQVVVEADERDKFRNAAIDGLLLRAGISIPKEKLAPGAEDLKGRTLLDIARECLQRAGIPTGLGKMELVARAFTHTSSDFPLILQNIANKALMAGFEAEKETWQKWCDVGSVSDFKVHTLVRIGEFDDLDQVPEGGEYKHAGKIAEQQEQYQIAKYGKLFSITRETIINDDLNALTAIPKNMGEAARRKIADLAYEVLISNPTMGDGKPLFHADHNTNTNYSFTL